MAAAKRMTKAQIFSEIADRTGLSKREVSTVFEALQELIKRELGKHAPWQEREKDGEVVAKWKDFIIPDMVKLKLKFVPARKNVKTRNPNTQEEIIRDREAMTKLSATPIKRLKELVL
ncbi:MAG: HU family DNA-binding protein [Myxococcota bacterium]